MYVGDLNRSLDEPYSLKRTQLLLVEFYNTYSQDCGSNMLLPKLNEMGDW